MKPSKLIEKYIEEDPHMPGIASARIAGTGVRVAILISYLRGVDWDADTAASAYVIPRNAVEAAHAYYHRHQQLIDAWILTNISGAEASIHA
jgi:uncharacterized protein (DUF433 family)